MHVLSIIFSRIISSYAGGNSCHYYYLGILNIKKNVCTCKHIILLLYNTHQYTLSDNFFSLNELFHHAYFYALIPVVDVRDFDLHKNKALKYMLAIVKYCV